MHSPTTPGRGSPLGIVLYYLWHFRPDPDQVRIFINGRSHYVSLKLNILQGFSSQDTGESGCMIPENRAAVQAVMGAFASAGCMLAETSPSSPLSHCQLHPPSEKLSNEMRWEQKLSPTSLPHPAAATSNVLEIPSTDQGCDLLSGGQILCTSWFILMVVVQRFLKH